MEKVLVISLTIIIAFFIQQQNAEKYEPKWESLDKRPLPSWFDEAKIGIFIHWGVFSVPSFGFSGWFWNYWNSHNKQYVDFMNKNYPPNFTYADFGPMFRAEFYEPSQWADIFEASGAKYVVLTSKHHEGFTLWPSKYSFNWNAKDVGSKRDLLGDLASAVRAKKDLRFGVYHSLYEWFNPLYLEDKHNGYKTQHFVDSKSFPELQELVTNYKPEVIWSDGDWEATDTYWKSREFLSWLYNDSPVKDTVVTNDRWGIGISQRHGDFYSGPDRFNPGVLQKHKWENAMTIDKGVWGYRRNVQLNDYLTIHELISIIAGTVSCGGNILVNIGPTPDGRIMPIFEERLRQMGQWLGINGEAIYKSKPWKHQNDTVTKNIWYTERSHNIYAIVLNWPHDNKVLLGAVDPNTISTVQMLGHNENLTHSAHNGGTLVTFPQLNPESKLRWSWVLKITVK